MKSFSLSVTEEFDAPSERPTWSIKLNGEVKARVVKTFLTKAQRGRGLVHVKPFVLMIKEHDGNAPWEPERGAPAFQSTLDALMHFLRQEVHEDNTRAG